MDRVVTIHWPKLNQDSIEDWLKSVNQYAKDQYPEAIAGSYPTNTGVVLNLMAKDTAMKFLIDSSILDEDKEVTSNAANCWEMIDILKKKYARKIPTADEFKLTILDEQLSSIKFSMAQHPEETIEQMEKLFGEIVRFGGNVDEKVKTKTYLKALMSHFKDICFFAINQKIIGIEVTSDHLKEMVVTHYLMNRDEVAIRTNCNPSPIFNTPQPSPRPNIETYYQSPDDPVISFEGTCNYCKEYGHKIADCQLRISRNRPFVSGDSKPR